MLEFFNRKDAHSIAEKEASLLNAELQKTPYLAVELRVLIDSIRRFPKPIAVDFNNVLANNESPLQLNPEAPRFLKELRKIGNVFIVTSASGWETLHTFMKENRLWSEDIVLLTSGIWGFLTDWDKNSREGKILRKEFLQTAKAAGWKVTSEDLLSPPGGKRVAPLFNKPFLVPIIDDLTMATEKNPGMLGINVKTWEPNPEPWVIKFNEDKITLKEAVEIVKDHYRA